MLVTVLVRAIAEFLSDVFLRPFFRPVCCLVIDCLMGLKARTRLQPAAQFRAVVAPAGCIFVPHTVGRKLCKNFATQGGKYLHEATSDNTSKRLLFEAIGPVVDRGLGYPVPAGNRLHVDAVPVC